MRPGLTEAAESCLIKGEPDIDIRQCGLFGLECNSATWPPPLRWPRAVKITAVKTTAGEEDHDRSH